MSEIRGAIDQNRADGGAGIRFLTETITSPTLIGQFKQVLSELPNAKWYQYEPVNNDNVIDGRTIWRSVRLSIRFINLIRRSEF